MREIQFRGKRVDNGEWAEGDLITMSGKMYMHPQANTSSVKNDLACMIVVHQAIPETVGQYTGLQDKYSEEIYEGDIVIVNGDEERYLVQFEEARFCIVGNGVVLELKEFYERDLEVIGNIHENSALWEDTSCDR